MSKLTASSLNFNVLGAAMKALVDTAVLLDGETQRGSAERKFALLVQTAR